VARIPATRQITVGEAVFRGHNPKGERSQTTALESLIGRLRAGFYKDRLRTQHYVSTSY